MSLSGKRVRKERSNMADNEASTTTADNRADPNPEHGIKLLTGLNKLKNERVLCDVTLIAEGEFSAFD